MNEACLNANWIKKDLTEEEAQEFKEFIQSIKPSDFAKLMKDNDHHESDQ